MTTDADATDRTVVDQVMTSVNVGDQAVIARILAAIEAGDPPTLIVEGEGRGWWPVDATVDAVTVHGHETTMTVPWASVALDE
ncbi:hypothetical protein OOJ91_12580 [Micromonospora lupini]|uniref:hypothetical protein n=1 Tax=Micromonospora lupini TaxID=285679 RepID=UPI00224FC740|nr:hypothetical protein [Micromonospora lupini]MCX5066716.1 hypothetical protein [Micromonospora lupini]